KLFSFSAGFLDQAFFFDDVQSGQCDRAASGMGRIGERVHPPSLWRNVCKSFVHAIRNTNAAEREITRGNSLGKRDDVWLNVPMPETKPTTKTTESGDYLIGHEQYFVLVANFTDARKIIVLRNHQTARPLHGFCQECGDGVGTFAQDRFLELIGS